MNVQVDIPQVTALRAELEVQPVASLHPSTRMAYTIFHPYGGLSITPNGSQSHYSLDYSRYAGGQQRSDRIPIHVPEGCRAILYFSGFDPNDMSVATVGGSRVTGDFEGEFERPGPICNEGADPVADDIYILVC